VEPIPLPKILAPEIKCFATPATQMELIKHTAVPVAVRLPDILDSGYFAFPQPTSSARVPFTIVTPEDHRAKGVLIYSGRTLTRSQDVVPAHTLVVASQVFYSGLTSWEVHVDRLGAGPGRVLAGIIINGTDGEGIVWDGHRIVGPNEGECRTIDDRFVLRPGTVLRFVLELDPPHPFLSCFFDRDGVARIPLPPTGNGWVPAFSVFGPQDQITVVPTSTSTKVGVMAQKAAARAAEQPLQRKLEEQEKLIESLQRQLMAVHSRIDAEQYRATMYDAQQFRAASLAPLSPQQDVQKSPYEKSAPSAAMIGAKTPSAAAAAPPLPSGQAGFNWPRGTSAVATTPRGDASPQQQQSAQASRLKEGYSNELQSLLKFLDDIKA
jgi:hypothetical protein